MHSLILFFISFILKGTEVVARRRNALSSFISKETEVGNDTEGTHLFKRRCYECFKHSQKTIHT